MRINRSLKLLRQYTDRVNGIMANAVRAATLTHGDILDAITERIYHDPDYQKCPQWVRAKVNSYIDGWLAAIWHGSTHWRIKLDGNLILGSDVPAGRWAEVETGNQVWNATLVVYA